MRRPLLLPLVPLYAAGLALARRFAGESKRLRWPVVSIGSLSAGGAGKTPVVAALAELLGRHGCAVDVLSRAYGRRSEAVEQVDPAGDAGQFGDEPLVLARAGLQVYVGADRYQAGLLAESTFQKRDICQPDAASGSCVHLLDDGFQHRRLARALDIVLLTKEDVTDWLLPAGNLREPLRQLRDAGAVILREDEAEDLQSVVARLAPGIPMWIVRRRLSLTMSTKKLVAFCGIARPEAFFGMLPMAPVGRLAFPDHHVYSNKDVMRLLRIAHETGANGFVTTEKDAVKLTTSMLGLLGELVVAGLRVEFVDEAAVIEQVVAHIGSSV